MTFDLSPRECKLLAKMPSCGQKLDSNRSLHNEEAVMLDQITQNNLAHLQKTRRDFVAYRMDNASRWNGLVGGLRCT